MVVPGKIYRSGQPTASQLQALLEEKGIRTVVNLRGADALLEDPTASNSWKFALSNGIKLINIKFRTPPTERNITRLLSVLDDEKNYPVLIHCAAGVVRTGLAVAVYRMERCGWSAEEALRELLKSKFDKKFRSDSDELDVVVFVSKYEPHHPLKKAIGSDN